MGSEHEEQVALFEWAAWHERQYPELALMFAIPNGGQRHIVVAKKLKDEGVKAGVPDIFLPEPRFLNSNVLDVSPSSCCYWGVSELEEKEDGGTYYCGLFIEMKVGRNKLTQNQEDWIEDLIENRYIYAICYGADEAIELLEWYLG